jgi:hypothetical protein
MAAVLGHGLEHEPGLIDHFRANAVTGSECDVCFH